MNILQCNRRSIPLLSAFPFSIPFCSPFVSLYLLGTLRAVMGSRPHRSKVARKLIFPFPLPLPIYPSFQNPDPPGSPRSKYTFIRTTSRTWLTRSRTPIKTTCWFLSFCDILISLAVLSFRMNLLPCIIFKILQSFVNFNFHAHLTKIVLNFSSSLSRTES